MSGAHNAGTSDAVPADRHVRPRSSASCRIERSRSSERDSRAGHQLLPATRSANPVLFLPASLLPCFLLSECFFFNQLLVAAGARWFESAPMISFPDEY